MELIFIPVVNFGEVRRAHLAKSTLFTSTLVPLGSIKVCSDVEERGGAESNGKLPHLFIPGKIATLVPEFTVGDLPLGRTAALVPGLAVKDFGQKTLMMMMITSVLVLALFLPYRYLTHGHLGCKSRVRGCISYIGEGK